MTKLENLKEKVQELNALLKKDLMEALKESVMDIFNDYTDLESFCWTQYTPYFNDGEPCEFCINDYVHSFSYKGISFGDYSSQSLYLDWRSKEVNPKIIEVGLTIERYQDLEKRIGTFLNSLNSFEKTIQSSLGEGLVTATREGFEIEDYDHE